MAKKKQKVLTEFDLWTDGACAWNPGGPGGWGFVLRDHRPNAPVKRKKGSGGVTSTTNNRMELMAILKGLQEVPEGASVTVCSDSKLCVHTFSRWIGAWQRRGWKKKDGEEPKNLDLVRPIQELAVKRKVVWRWVPGHAGISLNEEADALAVAAIPRRETTGFYTSSGQSLGEVLDATVGEKYGIFEEEIPSDDEQEEYGY